MVSSILNIGKSALAAAQTGLTTTGHNIANAATPGYSRQSMQQTTAGAQNFGFGFVGQGTRIDTVRRIYSDFLGDQVNASQSTKTSLDSYFTQISQIDNVMADPTAGLSPSLQGFFNGIQDLTASPNSAAARQATLSSAQALVARFQSLDQQLQENRDGINSQIASSVASINSYAERIASLNETITKASSSGQTPNDLLDQRDQLVAELSKETKATVVRQDGNIYNVFIGNGQALVVGATRYNLKATPAASDLTRTIVAYENGSKLMPLADSALAGGKLGGLLEFRAQTLDPAQNALGRTAIALASTFNAQHRLGQDLNGNLGGEFFSFAAPSATPNSKNTTLATLDVAITNASALTTSNYQVQYVGPGYQIKRLPDGTPENLTLPGEYEGFSLIAGGVAPAPGDTFLIKPTATGASSLRVAISDTSRIAAAAPILTSASVPTAPITTGKIPAASAGTISAGTVDAGYYSAPLQGPVTLEYDGGTFSGFPSGSTIVVTDVDGTSTTFADYSATDTVPYTPGATYSFSGVNVVLSGAPADNDRFTISPSGTGQISAGSVDENYVVGSLTPSVELTYAIASDSLSGFPAGSTVNVTSNGVTTTYPSVASGTAVDYIPDATYSFSGITFTLSGKPADEDTFTIGPNTNGAGDNRNAVLLGALQTTNTMGGTTTYQGSYSQLVSQIGNKTREISVNQAAETQQLNSAIGRQQSESGVNLDEEAANLLRYQQAYQAAGKVMQTASKVFDVLLSLGN
jgi:flagellar hook-associated protein 1 FlgK